MQRAKSWHSQQRLVKFHEVSQNQKNTKIWNLKRFHSLLEKENLKSSCFSFCNLVTSVDPQRTGELLLWLKNKNQLPTKKSLENPYDYQKKFETSNPNHWDPQNQRINRTSNQPPSPKEESSAKSCRKRVIKASSRWCSQLLLLVVVSSSQNKTALFF